jgi:hypothetical protein
VLPFANIGGDPDQEYFVDGVTESLTTDLSRISGSFVIARNTAFTYKGKPFDVKKIGHELGVRYVLEGSVQRGGSRMRVNVELGSLHALRRPAAEKRQGRKSRVGNGGGAATMGISPRAQASMWRNEAARYAILPRGRGVNWVVNGTRIVFVTQSCAFGFRRRATLT